MTAHIVIPRRCWSVAIVAATKYANTAIGRARNDHEQRLVNPVGMKRAGEHARVDECDHREHARHKHDERHAPRLGVS